jgi:hypothetical protein
MRRRSAASRRPDAAAVGLVLAASLAACSPRDAVVGAAAPLDGGADGPRVLFSSELAANGGVWDVATKLAGARATFGAASAGARDGRVAELRLPGGVATASVGPMLATEIATAQYFRFGTFRARVQFATCAPNEEIASAVFMYFHDGRDANANGIADTPELDLHVLCGNPSFVVMTAWSDYAAQNGVETLRKLARAVDTATGDVYDAFTPGDRTFTKTGRAPELADPGFPAANTFYDVGIDWQPTRVRFFIVRGGVEVTLWTMTDPAYVPQVPLPLMFNLWHPETHWVPTTSAADYPARDGVFLVDRAEWTSP